MKILDNILGYAMAIIVLCMVMPPIMWDIFIGKFEREARMKRKESWIFK